MVVSGHQFFIIKLSETCPGSVPIFLHIKHIVFIVLLQHLLMVASSSRSNTSQAKATHAPFKTGPLAKKAVAVLMAKAKKTKQQSIRKYVGIGRYFFY